MFWNQRERLFFCSYSLAKDKYKMKMTAEIHKLAFFICKSTEGQPEVTGVVSTLSYWRDRIDTSCMVIYELNDLDQLFEYMN